MRAPVWCMPGNRYSPNDNPRTWSPAHDARLLAPRFLPEEARSAVHLGAGCPRGEPKRARCSPRTLRRMRMRFLPDSRRGRLMHFYRYSRQRRVNCGKMMALRHEIDMGDTQYIAKLFRRHLHWPGRRCRAWRGLRKCCRHRGVKGDVPLHLLHHLMDMAIED